MSNSRALALLTTGEAARQLNISKQTLLRWARAAGLSPVTRPGAWPRWTAEQLEQLRGSQAAPPAPAPEAPQPWR